MKQLLSVTAKQMHEIDYIAVHQYGLQIIQMMENAGRALAKLSRILLGGTVNGRTIMVLVGGGNNGGGGLAAARNLHNWGATVSIALAVRKGSLKQPAAVQLNILESIGLSAGETRSLRPASFNKFDLILDALIGYGISGHPSGEFAHAIVLANQVQKPIISLDIPSGLDPTTGTPHKPSVMASATLTLALPKTGLLETQAADYVGELWLADIGIPPEIYAKLGLKGDNPFINDDLVFLRRKE